MKSKEVNMRTEASINGLKDMIEYINKKSKTKELTVLEIGSFHGDSTIQFLKNFKHVTAVDPWVSNIGDITNEVDMEEVYGDFQKNTKKYKNLTVIRDLAKHAVQALKDQTFDVIYIDGMHTYTAVRRDIKDVFPLLSRNGFICGHDFHPRFEGVIKAVNEFNIWNKDIVKFRDMSWLIEFTRERKRKTYKTIERPIN